ncbi:MAG TPA: exodeoxyribonuclease V subunit alpha, partial [Solirubrobacteraceae bacterium]|nr:exodeoxyribonuclease V subunit alpha [Solirubrobacteraceae bacterium]
MGAPPPPLSAPSAANASAPAHADPLDARRARVAPGLLRAFNDAGVLAAADVHVALRLGRLGGEADERVLLAAALATRAPRLGHVCVDLAGVRATAAVDREADVEVDALPWPEDPPRWARAVAASPLAIEGDGRGVAPLRLDGSLLYLDRLWTHERDVAADLTRLGAAAGDVDEALLADGLQRLFPGQTAGRQALAAATAVLRRLAVVAGGPGTGKTTTVAQIAALLYEQAAARGAREPLVALAAPTGKAAARLQEAVRAEAGALAVDRALRARLAAVEASTLHRLLAWHPGSHSRFRHDRANRLPHDVVIVDETSMVSLPLMARLLEAVRPAARLILIGDPGQLTSIEAGAVLGDLVGPAGGGLLLSAAAGERLARATGAAVEAGQPPTEAGIGDGIVVLDRVHRYGAGIARVADAIRRGDVDATLAALADPRTPDVVWVAADPAACDPAELAPVHAGAVAAAHDAIDAARAGDAFGALRALRGFRVLCAHRRGAHGVASWTERITTWLAEAIDAFGSEGDWYPGRPLLVTENDYALRLYNGDTGVVIAADGRPSAAFERGGEIVLVPATRLAAVDTVYAMTIHKSQGSQFGRAAVLLPEPDSRILTRELLYTAVTRAQERLVLVGREEAVRAAV